MSCAGDVYAEVRVLDIKRFVEDFVRKYEADPKEIKTPFDVFASVFHDTGYYCDGEELDPQDPNRNGCVISYEGLGVYSTAWCYDGLTNFFEWCIPYVEAETAFFRKGIDIWEVTGWRERTFFSVEYQIARGRLVEQSREVRDTDNGEPLAAPKVSEIVQCLKKRRPKAVLKAGKCEIAFGAFALESSLNANACRRVLDLYDCRDEYEVDDEPDVDDVLDKYHDVPEGDLPLCGRTFYSFDLRFDVSKRGNVRNVGFAGHMFDWNGYVVYDRGMTPKDLSAAIKKYVTIVPESPPKR